MTVCLREKNREKVVDLDRENEKEKSLLLLSYNGVWMLVIMVQNFSGLMTVEEFYGPQIRILFRMFRREDSNFSNMNSSTSN